MKSRHEVLICEEVYQSICTKALAPRRPRMVIIYPLEYIILLTYLIINRSLVSVELK
jgi:hypothetical protein